MIRVCVELGGIEVLVLKLPQYHKLSSNFSLESPSAPKKYFYEAISSLFCCQIWQKIIKYIWLNENF